MAYELLLSRIDERLTALGLSERKAALMAGVGVNTIRHIRNRGHAPKPVNLAKLASVLKVPAAHLLEAAAESGSHNAAPNILAQVPVRGAIQAGVWREALEWPEQDWYAITTPIDDRYPGIERFGLVVCGASMDRLYPEGTIVLVVKFGDLMRTPNPGERVVVLRRDRRNGEYEATLKEFDIDARGRAVLWPRSNDPEFQSPIILGGQIPLSFGDEPMPAVAAAGSLHDAGDPDVMVAALVVGSYRPE